MHYIGPKDPVYSSSKVRVGDRKKARREVREMEKVKKNRNANQIGKRDRKEDEREAKRKREKRTTDGTKEKGAKRKMEWSLERVKDKKTRMGPREMRGIEGKPRNRRTIERRAIPKLQWEGE